VTLFGPNETPEPSPEPAAPAGPLVRVRMTLAYDGFGFKGFAAQPGQKTVAGTLSSAMAKVVGHQVTLTCAGRTDSGVHAAGQVVHADLSPERGRLDVDALVQSCNRMLSPRIVVREAALVDDTFDARRSATSRQYRYRVLTSPVADPFLANTSWHLGQSLDMRAMRMAADALIGEHDFSAFCRRPPDLAPGEPLVRRVIDSRWEAEGEMLLSFWIEATSFCHQMVRSVVGTMVEVGRGRRTAADMVAALRSRDRGRAASPAPPHGLCLMAVSYDQPEPRGAEPDGAGG